MLRGRWESASQWLRCAYQGLLASPHHQDATLGNIPKILRQSFFALLICAAADTFAGFTIAEMAGILPLYPGLILLIPGVMGMRGNIFGSFGAMLGTSLHTGEIAPPYGSSRALRQQVGGAAVRTMAMSLVLALVVKALALSVGMDTIGIHRLILISVLTGILSGGILLVITIVITTESFRKGWDPDNISVPLITAAGDLLTVPILFISVLAVFGMSDLLARVFGFLAIAISIAYVAYALLSGDTILARITRQSLPVLIVCAILSTVAGTVMGMHLDMLTSFTAVLMLIPVVNAEGGNLGGILSSQLTSAYHLGATSMERRPDQPARKSFVSLIMLSMLLFPILGLVAHLVSGAAGLVSPGMAKLLAISVLGGLIATLLAILATYYLTYLFLKVGVDPDNVVIPIITSMMDVVGTICLILVTLAVL